MALSLPNIPGFLRDVRQELQAVQWPTRAATGRLTVLIIVVSIAVAIGAGALDYALSYVIQKLILP